MKMTDLGALKPFIKSKKEVYPGAKTKLDNYKATRALFLKIGEPLL